jgi:hypothetical protein
MSDSDEDIREPNQQEREFGAGEGSDDDEDDAGGGAFSTLLNSYYDTPPGGGDGGGDGEAGPSGGGSRLPAGGGGGGKPSPVHSPDSDNIDTPHFNSDYFVKNLLTNKPMENLIKIDNDMVHEIKALDSDMQMLVYENYNKFIGATETIKRMKTNVAAMDGDMEAVKTKMESISTKSIELDLSLAEKRSQVDKLVRVSRLLRRLEFLSELPERLELMISSRLYKQAVELFNKSVKVLEKHSHVLSFKNILERTQIMMTELRGKVLLAFDDPKLEVQELGVNVAVLRLLEAPPALIVSKFLAAHKQRCGRIVKQFVATLSLESTPPMAVASAGEEAKAPPTWAETQSKRLETVRIFHQNFILGLIEATRGVASVCKDVSRGSTGRLSLHQHHPSEDGPAAAPSGGGDGGEDVAVAVYEDLYAMIAIVLPDYTQALVRALGVFFHVYEEAVRSGDSGGGRHAGAEMQHSPTHRDTGGGANGDRDGQHHMGTSIREEHRQRWISFARQVITDCLYIDQEVDSTRPQQAERQLPLFDPLSLAVLRVLEQHQDCVFDKHVRGFLAAVCDYVGALSSLADVSPSSDTDLAITIKAEAKADLSSTVDKVKAAAAKKASNDKPLAVPATTRAAATADGSDENKNEELSVEQLVAASLNEAGPDGELGLSSGSASRGGRRDSTPVPAANTNTAVAAKAMLSARFGQSKSILDDLVNLFFSLFHSVCDDAQSLVEISAAAKQHRQMRQQQWRQETHGDSSGGAGDFNEGATAAHLLLWRYADAVAAALESYCGALRVAGCVSSAAAGGGMAAAHGSALDALSEHSLALEPWSSSGKNAGAGEMEIYTECNDPNDEDTGLGSDSGSDASEHSSGGSLSSSRSARAAGSRTHRIRGRKTGKHGKSAATFRFSSQSFESSAHHSEGGYSSMATAVVSLLASNVLAKVLPGMVSRMENSLRAFGMSISGGGSTTNSSRIRDKVTSRVSHASHMLLLAFIENRASDLSSGMSLALSMGRNVDALARETLLGPRDLTVTPGTSAVVKEMDRLAILCSIILGEMPGFTPPQTMRPMAPDRRGGSGLGGAGSTSSLNGGGAGGQGQYHLQLQLDIERMFSRRIPVFAPECVSLSSDAIMGAILKAGFKACEQNSRTFCLTNLSSVQLSMDAIFMKLVSVCFLKGDSYEDVESIADQVSVRNNTIHVQYSLLNAHTFLINILYIIITLRLSKQLQMLTAVLKCHLRT